MLTLLKDYVNDTTAPFLFLVLFLVIVGGSLWLTPRLARWLDKQDRSHKSYYDGMLTEDPNAPKEEAPDGKMDGSAQ